MTKTILIIIIFCQCIMLSIGFKSYAQPQTSAQDIKNMQRHIDEMKIKNPIKYEEMVKRAGGNITQCADCHQEVLKGNLPGQKGMEGIRPLRK